MRLRRTRSCRVFSCASPPPFCVRFGLMSGLRVIRPQAESAIPRSGLPRPEPSDTAFENDVKSLESDTMRASRNQMTPQESIAHYRIVSKLGEGGMGAVYRATDTKLNRDVAIKVLPAAFTGDAGRMHRFEREAQMLASLNHPNIAGIYGIEEGAIVMELVEGASPVGPLPVETVID